MLEDPKELMREFAERKEKEEAERREKAARKAALKREEIKAMELQSVKPGAFFTATAPGVYSKIDETGVPTHLSNGEELKKAQRKKLSKDLKKHAQKQEKLAAKAEKAGVTIEALIGKAREELKMLEAM